MTQLKPLKRPMAIPRAAAKIKAPMALEKSFTPAEINKAAPGVDQAKRSGVLDLYDK
jgi:hypothetical protein